MGITEVTIPNSVETFDGNPFVLNYQLQSFKGKYATADNEALIKDGVFVSIVGNRWFEEYNIPDGVTEIGGGAFKDNRAFGKINIPASVTKIGDEAFTGQFNVVFTWSDNITEIGYQGFAYCFMYGTIENLVLPATPVYVPLYTLPASSVTVYETSLLLSTYSTKFHIDGRITAPLSSTLYQVTRLLWSLGLWAHDIVLVETSSSSTAEI